MSVFEPVTPNAAPPRPYRRTTVWLILALTALILGLWWLGTPDGIWGKANAIGYAVCHRIADRSFLLHGTPLPLCARCTGMYMGVMIGLGTLIAGRRGRAARLPPLRVLALLGVFVLLLAADGINSYLHLFPGFTGLYEPQNWLRLITGSLTGVGMIGLLLPTFNSTVWATPQDAPPLKSLAELGDLLIVIGLADTLVLLNSPAALLIFGLLSAAGPLVVLTMVGAVLFVSLTGRENSLRSRCDLLLPILAGLAFAFAVVGGIDALRFALTGTWDGFDFSALLHR